jgi:hypothetical protein
MDMARKQLRIEPIGPTHATANNDLDGSAFVEIRNRIGTGRYGHRHGAKYGETCNDSLHDPSSPMMGIVYY